MMDNVSGVRGTNGMNPTRRTKTAYRPLETPKAADSVELSGVMRLRGVEGTVRLDRVMAVKSQIDAGTYFTPEKLDAAFDRAFDQLFG
jgi:anti-sigma28 factor (negative regulator of flagellin synthesis)